MILHKHEFSVNNHNWEMEDAEVKSAVICQDTIGRVEVSLITDQLVLNYG